MHAKCCAPFRPVTSSSQSRVRAVAVRASCDEARQASSSSGRRHLLGAAAVGALGSQLLGLQLPRMSSAAEEQQLEAVEVAASSAAAASTSGSGRRVYLDVKVEGQSLGRIVVELLDDVATGAQRFADLAEGKEGVGYRLSKFDGIFPSYVRNEGVKSLSYNADGTSLIAGGDSMQALEAEMDASSRRHDTAGLVSLVVREAVERPVKERLVAMGGKLVTLKEQAGEAPNGTAFMITTGPAPELDVTNLVVGRVVGGSDVVAAMAALPFAKPRDSYYDKPFFEAGKMMGDKRATVAEKRFRRPLKRVMVANAGAL